MHARETESIRALGSIQLRYLKNTMQRSEIEATTHFQLVLKIRMRGAVLRPFLRIVIVWLSIKYIKTKESGKVSGCHVIFAKVNTCIHAYR